jgi:hypothetical protein
VFLDVRLHIKVDFQADHGHHEEPFQF